MRVLTALLNWYYGLKAPALRGITYLIKINFSLNLACTSIYIYIYVCMCVFLEAQTSKSFFAFITSLLIYRLLWFKIIYRYTWLDISYIFSFASSLTQVQFWDAPLVFFTLRVGVDARFVLDFPNLNSYSKVKPNQSSPTFYLLGL